MLFLQDSPEHTTDLTHLRRGGSNYNKKVFISNSGCQEDADYLTALVEETFPNIDGGVKQYNIGTIIGSHTGRGTVELFFFGNERTD